MFENLTVIILLIVVLFGVALGWWFEHHAPESAEDTRCIKTNNKNQQSETTDI